MNKQDRTVIITGGASGIGKSLCYRYGRAGYTICIGDIEEPALTKTVDDLAKEGIVEEKRMILFDGNIITSNKDNSKSDLAVYAQVRVSDGCLQNYENRFKDLKNNPIGPSWSQNRPRTILSSKM